MRLSLNSKLKKQIWKILEWIAPRILWNSIRFEWQMFKIRLLRKSQAKRALDYQSVFVNLGAGNSGLANWVNLDVSPEPGVTFTCDCRAPLPLPSNCALGIFTEHFLEHIEYENDVPSLLKECLRILQPGGVIRIVVPDCGRYLHAYCQEGWAALEKLRELPPNHQDPYFLKPLKTKMELVNLLFRQNGEHKFAYDYETLEMILQDSGFTNVVKCEFGVSSITELAIDQHGRAHESLYVEASKPND